MVFIVEGMELVNGTKVFIVNLLVNKNEYNRLNIETSSL